MSAPSAAHSVVEPSPWTKRIAGAVVVCYALLSMVPLVWIVLTGFKTPTDSIAYPPKVMFEPSLEGYVNLFTTRSRQTPEYIATLPPASSWYDELVRSRSMVIAGPSKFAQRYVNSLVIGFGSTALAVFLGVLAAYAFSRFRVPLRDDLLFFILSTRMMPPIAVAIPIYLMYKAFGLTNSYFGLVMLYTVVYIPFAVWLLVGFLRDFPVEIEEAAMIDGCSRLRALVTVVMPIIAPGMAVVALFAFIATWNEFLFAVVLTGIETKTMMVLVTSFTSGGTDMFFGEASASVVLGVLPAFAVAFALQRYLVKGLALGGTKG